MIRRLMVAIEGVSQVHGGPEALVAMAEFVLLPLILILQSGVDMRSSGMQTRPSDQSVGRVGVGPSQLPSLNQYLVLRSAQMRCVEDAAVALERYFDYIGTNSNSLDDAILLRCLVSMTMSLSAVEMALSSNGEEKKKSADSRDDTNHSTALDDGDGCRLAILRTISRVFIFAGQETGGSPTCIPDRLSDSTLSRTIATHMDGVLMIRIVGGCMTILQGLLVADDGGHVDDKVKKPTDPGRGNWKLGVAVLDTLEIMLCSVPHQEIWRHVLPGAFATLFRVSLKSCRTRASGALLSSGARAISTIALLLRVSIGMKKLSTEKTGSCFTENIVTISGSTSSALPMTLAASRLFSAASLAGGTTAAYSDGRDGSKADVSSKSAESSYLDEVNSRLPGPLTMIIRIGSAHTSAKVRRAIINLVDAVLVDTRTCWSQTTKDALFTVALECCLSLLNDSDGEFEP